MKLPPIISQTRHKVVVAIREWYCDPPKTGVVGSTWGIVGENSSLRGHRMIMMYLAPAGTAFLGCGWVGRRKKKLI